MCFFNKFFQKADPKWCAVDMLPPCLFRSSALTLSWAVMSYGTSCLVCLLCQPFSNVCCSSSVQKAPDTFTSSWMRKPRQRKVSLWWFSFLPIVLESSVNEKHCTWMDTHEIGTNAFQMKSVIVCKNMQKPTNVIYQSSSLPERNYNNNHINWCWKAFDKTSYPFLTLTFAEKKE